ncbi:metal ABC transporter substrate-binding protein [Streptomyces tubercidicus]|uniref:Zinc ABC transporter substrate-binding protein n=1 Tax=Streptomyces tubercidicus TaxID=47759 RepID=A0A640UWT7_9ACTN|nr:metal ABC transporter substrate-binding protein [Streptomyces tubercidicus]WAU14236.1 metal ABC transporter substrate-binding protein [Streptomyces tubercidicus]GFE39947.1 zinc ABC transporter substrate-binding protein [Streptomyces tubercidicus]
MNIRRPISTATLAGVSVLGLLALSACSPSGGARTEDGKLRVTASFYPMEFLAQQIGGKHVEVTSLTKPGAEPHDLELSPQQTAQLGESGAVVYLKGLQPAVDEAVKQSGAKHVADAAALTSLEEHGTEVDGHHHTTGDNHSHSESEGGKDPHIWLDPVKYAEVAKGVNKTLAQADPDHKADYQKNTNALVKKLDGLNTAFKDGLKKRSSDTFLTTHAAFGYLAERYGLTEEAISGLDPEAEPSAKRIRDLHTLAREHHVSTVFFETIANPATAKALAGDLHLKTDVLDPLEGINAKSRGKDYFGVQRANLAALQKALGSK